MSGRKPGSSTTKSRAVEARLSAAMAIYAGAAASPGTPGGGPVSDDDYFTDDGVLDPDKVGSPRRHRAAIAAPDMAAIKSPTNARNAGLTGAAPPPTLGEIESHLNDSHGGEHDVAAASAVMAASPSARSTISTASGSSRMRPMPENSMGGGGRSHRRKTGKKLGRGFFDESFEDAFPADNLDAFHTSVDRGANNTHQNHHQNKGRAAPSPSAQRKADRGATANANANKAKGALHDPFGTMPSLPTPTSSASDASVAARRRARAAATTGSSLSIDTGIVTSPTDDAAGDATSPTTMLDFALQGTPVAAAAATDGGTNAGYPSEDDDGEEEQEGVLGAVASPRAWKGASAASSKVDTSREGLIGADDLSPSNAPTVMSDAEARLEEERERREAEEKKNRFLSKMIMRVSCSNNEIVIFIYVQDD